MLRVGTGALQLAWDAGRAGKKGALSLFLSFFLVQTSKDPENPE